MRATQRLHRKRGALAGPEKCPPNESLVVQILEQVAVGFFETVGKAQDLKTVAIADGPNLQRRFMPAAARVN